MRQIEDERVDTFNKLFDKLMKTDIIDQFGIPEEKIEVIVGFLAMLELVRQGILDAIQETGGDIIMEKQQKEFV